MAAQHEECLGLEMRDIIKGLLLPQDAKYTKERPKKGKGKEPEN